MWLKLWTIDLGYWIVSSTALSDSYTTNNVTTDRVLDADNTTVNELADVLWTIIEDMQVYGWTTNINDLAVSPNTTYSSQKIDADYVAATPTTHWALINWATEKTTPVDADMFWLMNSEDSNILYKLSLENLKAALAKKVVIVTQSATPTINTDLTDVAHITWLAQAITSFSMSWTPIEWDMLRVDITDNWTARAITWWTSFEASSSDLPTTTEAWIRIDVVFVWNTVTSKWRIVWVA